MKHIFLSSLLFIGSFFCGAQNINSPSQVNLNIDGMHCAGGCAMGIQRMLNSIDGVTALVNFANANAIVEYDANVLSDQKIITIINSIQGGKFTASLASDSNEKNTKMCCSKGKACCQKTGKAIAGCDKSNKGCCASAQNKSK